MKKHLGSWSPKLLLKCLRYRGFFRRKAERAREEVAAADLKRDQIRHALSQIAQHVPFDERKRRFASGAGASALMLALLAAGISVTAPLTEAQADTFFTLYPFAGTGSPSLRTMPDRLKDVFDVKEYGALGDGTGAALSTKYGSLGAAQVVYPFATSLTQSLDWAASRAVVAAATQNGGQLGRIIYPIGIYKFSTGDYVPLPPELFHGGGASWSIVGGSPGSTAIYGNVNGFLFDTSPSGNIAYTTGAGFALRDISLNNQNGTAFTSGGVRFGNALGVTVDNVDVSGCMVGITNELAPGQRTSNNSMSLTNINSSGQQRTNSIGIVAAGDGIFMSNINLNGWEYAICINADGVFIGGSHFESNKNVFMMGRTGSASGAGTGGAPALCADVVISGVTVEGNISTVVGFQGISHCTFINLSGQVHDIANWQGAGLQAQYGFDFRNGIAGCVFINVTLSGQPANANFVVHQANPSSGDTGINRFINTQMTDLTGAPSWDVPTSGIARAIYIFDQGCNCSLYLPTASLPWDTLTGATITNDTLTFTSGGGLTGTRGLFPNSGALITGASVVANTKILKSGSAVWGATFDDGAGGPGNTMTVYGPITGVTLGIGAVLTFNCLMAYGPNLQNMVINGTALTFDVASFTGTMVGTKILTVASPTGAILQPGMRLYPNATFGADCYLMSQIDATHWNINKTLTFAGVSCQAEADLRAGYSLDLSTSFGYTAVAIATRVSIGSYTVNNSQTPQAPQSGGLWLYLLQGTLTLTAGSGSVWTFTYSGGGGTLNVGVSGVGNGTIGSGGVFAVPFNNTYQLNRTYGAPVGPESMSVYCDFEGDEYNVSDSATAFSMGAVMSLAGGGSVRCRVRRNDGQGGYIITG